MRIEKATKSNTGALPESLLGAAGNASSSSRLGLQSAFSSGDFQFFKLLDGLAYKKGSEKASQAAQSQSLGLLDEAAIPDDSASKPSEVLPSTDLTAKLLKAKIEHVRHLDKAAEIEQQKILELMTVDLTADDRRFLEQALVANISYPGGVPLQQMVPLSLDGKPNFSRLAGSASFTASLNEAYAQGKSLRVALDEGSAVILKFHQGKVSAEFMSQDPKLAMAMKQSMDELRQSLSEKSLPVADLSYRDESKEQPENEASDPESE